MHIVFVDDSIAFDGWTPSSQPLGGPEKAVVGLATALGRRGHKVQVVNRCEHGMELDGAEWIPWDAERPASADAVIACRHPRLLDLVAGGRRVLWATGPSPGLDGPEGRALLARHTPSVWAVSKAQVADWPNPEGLPVKVIQPGVAAAFVEADAMMPDSPPRAICTTHPLAGLDWLLTIWQDRVRPVVPGAELHVYSAMLDKGQFGGEVAPQYQGIVERALSARVHGVYIRRPAGDAEMFSAYRRARLHVYPGQVREAYGWTLAESQATGLPAVARALAAVTVERIYNAKTGFIAAGDDTFSSAVISLLTDSLQFDRMSATARIEQRGRTWHVAADEFEAALGEG